MTAAEALDPVDPRQRRHARVLGLLVAAAFLAVMGGFFTVFSLNGLPKDPKEWKRLQERRSAAETEKAAQAPIPVPTSEKDAPR